MPVAPDDRLTLVEHLDELRRRIIWSLVALAVGVVVAAVFNSFVFDALLWPLRRVPGLPATAYKITTFSPAEPFVISLKVWVVAGVILASPFLIWQFWAFVGPAFETRHKKYLYLIALSCSGLFLGGIALAYFVVLPKGLQFLLGFNSGSFNVQNRASEYLTFMSLFVLAFGVVFEMPVVLVLLARLGIIDDAFLRKNRRYAILINAVLAAVITPSQDAFSMMAMLIPLLILYEVSIVIIKRVQVKRVAADSLEQVDDEPGDDLGSAPA